MYAVRFLVVLWRRAGYWLFILRYARIRFRWVITFFFGSVFCSRDFFVDFVMVRSFCVCREFLLVDFIWFTVIVDG